MGKEGRRGGNEKGGELESLMILFLLYSFQHFQHFPSAIFFKSFLVYFFASSLSFLFFFKLFLKTSS